jgi:mRNA-degrading endonuclease RelE of RelBE toxin-antitoxin system
MSYKIELSPNFIKEAKHLSKKYPSFNADFKLSHADLINA